MSGETGLSGNWITISKDGGVLDAYLVPPPGSSSRSATRQPALCLVHDHWGLERHSQAGRQHLFGTASMIAGWGYWCLCPDLFAGADTGGGSLPDGQAMEILDIAFDWLAGHPLVDPNRIGIIGFCWGGRLALLYSTYQSRLAAAVDFYGRAINKETSELRPEHAMDRLEEIRCPVLGLFGEEDHSVPVAQVRELEQRLTHLGKAHRIVAYPRTGHAFMNFKDPKFHREEAELLARTELRSFLSVSLQAGSAILPDAMR